MKSETYTYDGHDPGGTKSLSMRLPVMDTDALQMVINPVLLGKPPVEYAEETPGIEPGKAYLAFGPERRQTPVPEHRVEDVQIDVLDTFYDDFEGSLHDPDPDDLDIGEAFLLARAELMFKRIEGWRMCQYKLVEEETERVEFYDDPEAW